MSNKRKFSCGCGARFQTEDGLVSHMRNVRLKDFARYSKLLDQKDTPS